MNEPQACRANYLEQKRRELGQRFVASGENPHIRPRIEIMLNWQNEDVRDSGPIT